MSVLEAPSRPAFPSSACDVFPFVMLRIAAGPFEDLAALDLVQSSECLTSLRAARHAAATAAATLVDEIYAAIGGCTDVERRRLLLRAKRDLFNGRTLDAETIAALGAAPARLPHLDAYAAAVADAAAKEHLFEAAFASELAESRRILTTLASAEALQRPLVLSSEVLLDQIRRYCTPGEGPISGKDLDVERALMKYLPRMNAKTSPFSTFCDIAIATMGDTDGALVVCPEGAQRAVGVRINNFAWATLRPLILSVPAIADSVPLRPNPTITSSPDGVKFLVNIRNIESFQSLPPLEGIEQIIALAADLPSRATLVDRIIAAELVEGDAEDVRKFVDTLVDYGLLEPVFGVSGIDPDWDRSLVALLTPLASSCEEAAAVIEMVNQLRADAEELGRSPTNERRAVLKRACERFEATRVALAKNIDLPPPASALAEGTVLKASQFERSTSIVPSFLFFEDCTLAQPLVVHRQTIEAFADSVSHALAALTFTDAIEQERSMMRHYYLAKYGPGAVVPLVRFYEDYYRDCKVPMSRRGEKDKPAAHFFPGSDDYGRLGKTHQDAVAAWTSALESRVVERMTDDRVYIERADVEAAFEAAPALWPERPPQSSSAFFQLSRDRSDGLQAVLNVTGPGWGKAMNRFFHLLPPQVTETQRAMNTRTSGGSLLAEIYDASTSNANLHPPLTQHEIFSPGAQGLLGPEHQLPVSDLVVHIDGHGELRLVHEPSASRVEVLDLGLQGMTIRAQMFRFAFYGFARARHVNWLPMANAAAAAWKRQYPDPKSGVVFLPRIVYDRRLVVRRRSWTVPESALPLRSRGETDRAYFARLDEWREQLGLPPYVFVFLTRDRAATPRKGKLQKDDHKPQFVSFANWFTVSLFEKMLSRVHQEMTIEEMLPLPGDMIVRDGKRYAAELVVQLYRREWP